MELADTVAVGEEMLESGEFLDVVEIFQAVVVDFYAFYGVASLEGVYVELLYFVVVDVELF